MNILQTLMHKFNWNFFFFLPLPLSMYLTAASSLVFLSLTSLATLKFPESRSSNGKYLFSISNPTPKINKQINVKEVQQRSITEKKKHQKQRERQNNKSKVLKFQSPERKWENKERKSGWEGFIEKMVCQKPKEIKTKNKLLGRKRKDSKKKKIDSSKAFHYLNEFLWKPKHKKFQQNSYEQIPTYSTIDARLTIGFHFHSQKLRVNGTYRINCRRGHSSISFLSSVSTPRA